MTDGELDLVETNDIVRSLQRRSDAMLLVQLFRETHGIEASEVSFSGRRIQAIGLAEIAKDKLMRMMPDARPM